MPSNSAASPAIRGEVSTRSTPARSTLRIPGLPIPAFCSPTMTGGTNSSGSPGRSFPPPRCVSHDRLAPRTSELPTLSSTSSPIGSKLPPSTMRGVRPPCASRSSTTARREANDRPGTGDEDSLRTLVNTNAADGSSGRTAPERGPLMTINPCPNGFAS